MHSTAIAPRTELVFRHSLVVRITHWVNALCLLVLLMSGLQIFNAHPTLYWGSKSDPTAPSCPCARCSAMTEATLGSRRSARTRSTRPACSGSRAEASTWRAAAFPAWITLPSYRDLATGRRWHFFFAWLFVLNGLAYLIYRSPAATRAATSRRREASFEHIGASISEHMPLPLSQGRGGEALQRAAEARLSGRHLRPAAARDPHRADHVAGARRGLPVPARPVRRPPDRRAPCTSSCASRHRAVRRRACRHGARLGRAGTTCAR